MFEITVSLKKSGPLDSDILKLVVSDFGISAQDIVETEYKGQRQASFYISSSRQAAFMQKELSSRLNNLKVSCRQIKDKDWKIKWKDYLKPFDFAGGFRIVPLWAAKEQKKSRKKLIFIDTDIVFGAGTHPTSQMVAGFIEKKQGLFSDFLDIGTGTGILSITAHKCGAHRIWALDISDDAIKIAERNFDINGCSAEYLKAVDFKKFRTRRRFDFVAANILTEDLIRLNKELVRCVRPGKYLAVSGISLNKLKDFRRRFDESSLRCLSVRKQDGWAAILYKKSVSN